MKRTALLLFVLIATLSSSAQETHVFARRDTADLKLDIYRPARPRGDGACVLYVYGGGFAAGRRNDDYSRQCCQMLADRGFVAVAMDYRLYLQHPAQVPLLRAYTLFDTAICWAVEDCSDAIAYLCEHADSLSIDPSKMVLTGCSAGAITVLQTDYCRTNRKPEAAALPATFAPAAVVAYAGGVFCTDGRLHYGIPPAPTCLIHGTCDKVVSYGRLRGGWNAVLHGANSLARHYSRQGYCHWILRFADRGHEIASSLPFLIDEFCAFADAALSGRAMQYDATCTDAAIKRTKWTDMTLLDLYRHP